MTDLMNNDDVVPAVDNPAVPGMPVPGMPPVVPLDDEDEDVVDGAGAVGDSSEGEDTGDLA
ncbi:hypothetical protein A2886_00140 [candidate division WWE3 bacterium RIFCSPHIGHO2_01_FULL_42_13]|uniref:Uncharacterized protein n=1 Tax=candidate division WWE3 bacterium RIFCSPHIGHO2_01_FULL_42_13 TaxID=1802617 RepID=A0A1F4UR00_UNCKA|nr:MAG: hypothetical protein A2886_00140 [candidate division WWE3 bacterium RIFCSPHIGHO2_01_FULL_42_13]